jgi:hypothetical protein
MNVEELVELYRACGSRCLQTGGIYWLVKQGKVALSLPTLDDAYPTREQIRELFGQNVRAARFVTAGPWESTTTEFVLTKHPYTLDVVQQKSRNQVRRGLERCEIRTPTEADLLERGYEINSQTLTRQGREEGIGNASSWKRYMGLLLANKDIVPFGAYVDNRMVAFVFVFMIAGKLVLVHPFLDREYSKLYPMNAMVFTAINTTRERFGPLPVSYGFGSIWNIDSLDHFKMGMGFDAIPRLRITVFRGIYHLAINRTLSKVVNALPVMRDGVGRKYGRLVDEKELGLEWWLKPTVPGGARGTDPPQSGNQ